MDPHSLFFAVVASVAIVRILVAAFTLARVTESPYGMGATMVSFVVDLVLAVLALFLYLFPTS